MAEKKTKAGKKKKKAGRKKGCKLPPHPTKKYLLQPETLEFIKRLSSQGHAEYMIAGALNIHRNTLAEWKKENPELRHALEQGRLEEYSNVMKKLSELALSGKYPYLTEKYAARMEDNFKNNSAEHIASENNNKSQQNQLGKIGIKQLQAAIKKDPFIEIEAEAKATIEDTIQESMVASVIDQDVSELTEEPEFKDVTPGNKVVEDPFIDN